MEKTTQKILKLIQDNKQITLREIAENLKLTRNAIEKQISKLKKSGIIKRLGSDRSGAWEIIKTLK